MKIHFDEIDKEIIIKKWKCFLGLCLADCPNGAGTFNGICSVYADGPLYGCGNNERDQIEIKIIEKLLAAQDLISYERGREEQRKRDVEIAQDCAPCDCCNCENIIADKILNPSPDAK